MRWRSPSVATLLVAAALVGIVAWGVALRMEDPLSHPAVAAEDPYSHVVFTKEAVARGYFGDSDWLGTSLYPPGIHAFTGGFAPLAGVPLEEMARYAPVVLGALAILGVFALASRLGGTVAGLVAALLVAVMPEHIFRTNLFAPTAFDLAVVPAWLLAFHLAFVPRVAGERPWRSGQGRAAAALFLLLAIPLAYLHPWAVVLFAIPAAMYAALRILRLGEPALALPRAAWAAGLVVLVSAFAMATRWKDSDTGFADFFLHLGPLAGLAELDLPLVPLFAALLAILAVAAAPAVLLVGVAARVRGSLPALARLVAGALAALGLVLVALALGRGDLPEAVNYENMLGGAAVALALAGVVVACVRPTPVGEMGLALGVFLLPLTAIDLFSSPFWPQRTVAYLSLGVALLGGAAAEGAREAVAWALARGATVRLAAPVAVAGSLLLVGSAVATDPGSTYEWYRLYPEEQYHAFERAADRLAAEPDARIVVYDWQPALMLKALSDPTRVKYGLDAFKDAERREQILDAWDGPQYLLVDKYALKGEAKGKGSTSFVQGWTVVDSTADGQFVLYEVPR